MKGNKTKEKITGTDTKMAAILKMVEGNPGALTVCLDLIKHGERIDPDDIMGGFGNILGLDSLGVYGSEIWVLYKDVCRENIVNLIGVLRAEQFGFLPATELLGAIRGNNLMTTDRIKYLIEEVKTFLPNFNSSVE